MYSKDNSLENLIGSFLKVCSYLEVNAEVKLKQADKLCSEDFNLGAKTINKFNDLINGLSETCSELLGVKDLLKTTENFSGESSIALPYGFQSEAVTYISELYNLPVNKKNEEDCGKMKEIVKNLIKICEKNVAYIKDTESTIRELKIV